MKPASPGWHPLVAYIAPFILFAILTSLEGYDSLREWYPLLYACKTILILCVLWWGFPHYPAWSKKGIGAGVLYGLLGGIVWIVLCTWSIEKDVLPGLLTTLGGWLNLPSLADWIKPGDRVGYNPFTTLAPAAAWCFVLVRLVGLVLVVPMLEEVFWRGFLNRIFIDENWQQVAWGKVTRLSFIVVTLAFVAVHAEWTAALVWGVGIHLLYAYTKNLWACVVAHAVSNAVLGYYILAHQQWHLW